MFICPSGQPRLLQIFSARYRELVPENTKKGVCALIIPNIYLKVNRFELCRKSTKLIYNNLFIFGKLSIFATAMMKYLLYFFVLVSVFLTSGSSSTPENQQKYKDIYTMYSPNEDKTEYNIPQADIERYEKELYNGKQSYKMEDGYIRASLLRNISTSKNSRTNLSSSAERIVRFIKTQYPKERQTFISFCINPLKFSYGYYIYTLRRILI